MHSITHAHGATHVAVAGDPAGLPLVFANSLGTDLRVWDALLPLLPEGLRIIRYDMRGHGLSDAPDAEAWTVEDLADDLDHVLATLGVGGAVICGLSVGGLVAQGLAARHPERVRALVLCCTAARIGTAEMWNDRIAAVRKGGIEALADGILERWFSPRFRAEDPAFPLWRNMLTRTPPRAYAATCAALRDADLRESTRALDLPALVLAGELDGATPPDLVRDTAQLLSGARFALIPAAGHIPCVEAPEATAAQIGAFLKEIGS